MLLFSASEVIGLESMALVKSGNVIHRCEINQTHFKLIQPLAMNLALKGNCSWHSVVFAVYLDLDK